MVTGANEDDFHLRGVEVGRDLRVTSFCDLREVREGEACPLCGAALAVGKSIEIGHIFQLGRKYAEALDLTVLDENGKSRVVTMGSYGIGVSRAVGAIVEQHHDDRGIVWPRSVAPADVHVVAAGKDDAIFEAGEVLVSGLVQSGLTVLYDDRRGPSAGVKFNDSELIGVPTIVVVGRKLGDGVIEVKDRATGERRDVELVEAIGHIVQIVRG